MKKITIIGGDGRLRVAAKVLKESFVVDTIGLYEGLSGDTESSDAIVLPVPTTKDGKTVFTPFCEDEIYLDAIAEKAGDRLILSCNYMFENKNCIDYNKLDSFCRLNAVPTAEGAIKIALENTDFTLWKSRVLVIGAGKCGFVLAERLKSLGAFVTVAARKPCDFALLESLGFDFTHSEKLNEEKLNYDIIFNTVDAIVLNDKALKNTSARLIIDISTKGGFSLADAEQSGIKAIKAPGLPGKTAPITAGRILAETVKEIINQRY